MNYYCLTLFPEMIQQALSFSVIGRAQQNGLIQVEAIDIREFSLDKHKHVDDAPYGGGAGMVMQAPPVYDAYQSVANKLKKPCKVLYLTPQGSPLTQNIVKKLALEENLILLCGHYEGIDERIVEEIVTDELSLGDFVMTGGEIAAVAVIDAVSRLIPGVLGKEESFEEESFHDGLLEYPQYTRPPVFLNKKVPDILLSGHHGNIAKWRKEQSILRTLQKRPDLLPHASLTQAEKKKLLEFQTERKVSSKTEQL